MSCNVICSFVKCFVMCYHVFIFMYAFDLKISYDKSKVVITDTSSKVQLFKGVADSKLLGNSFIPFSPTVENLRIFFDESLTILNHIKKDLRQIHDYFDTYSFKTILQALNFSKISYGNSLSLSSQVKPYFIVTYFLMLLLYCVNCIGYLFKAA